jgi:hypothetical protein
LSHRFKIIDVWYYFSAPLIPGSGLKGGELARETPPREYDDIRIEIAKIRESSEYLNEALRNPVFDIDQLYRINLHN